MKKEAVLAMAVGIVLLVVGALMVRRQVKRQLAVVPTSPAPVEAVTATSTPAPTPTPLPAIKLKVTSHTDGALVDSGKITLRGITAPKAEVFVNEAETKADANGNFSVNLTLDEGENYLLVSATDSEGNWAEQELLVTYEP